MSERRDTIVALLETLTDVCQASRLTEAGVGTERVTSRAHTLDDLYHQGSYRELEVLLARMRNQAKQQAYKGWSVGTLRFHVLAWYVTPVRVIRQVPVTVRVKGKVKTLRNADGSPQTRPLRVNVRDKQAREDRARLGVEWLELEWIREADRGGFRWPQLPDFNETRKAA